MPYRVFADATELVLSVDERTDGANKRPILEACNSFLVAAFSGSWRWPCRCWQTLPSRDVLKISHVYFRRSPVKQTGFDRRTITMTQMQVRRSHGIVTDISDCILGVREKNK